MAGLLAVGYFLFSVLFNIVIFVLWVRLVLRYFRVSVLHPMHQLILRFTDPVVLPFQWMIKKVPGSRQPYDWPCLIVLVLTELLKFTLVSFIFARGLLPWEYIPVYACADLIIQPCDLLFYAIVIRVIMSWVNPHWQHPIADIIRLITEPALRLARRLLPDMMGLDFSPLLVIFVVKAITIFIRVSLPLNLV